MSSSFMEEQLTPTLPTLLRRDILGMLPVFFLLVSPSYFVLSLPSCIHRTSVWRANSIAPGTVSSAKRFGQPTGICPIQRRERHNE